MDVHLISEAEWRSILSVEFDSRVEIFFRPEYSRAWALQEDAEGCCLLVRLGRSTFIYPFLRRRHPTAEAAEPYCDIWSPYGYGGILCNDPAITADVVDPLNRGIDDWCRAHHVVAELLREDPCGDPLVRGRLRRIARTLVRRNVYYLLGPDRSRTYLGSAAARAVRHAQRHLTTRIVDSREHLPAFEEMYVSTMKRLGAAGFYFFHHDTFQSLVRHLDNRLALHMVCRGVTAVAGALCVRSGSSYVSLLVAWHDAHQLLRPVDLLYYGVLEHARETGLSRVSWGGGITAAGDDGLYRFKEKYGNFVANCYIGTKVHNATVYEQSIAAWERNHPALVPTYGSWLLRHHQTR